MASYKFVLYQNSLDFCSGGGVWTSVGPSSSWTRPADAETAPPDLI